MNWAILIGREVKPVPFDEYVRDQKRRGGRAVHVGDTETGRWWVSTIFLGLNHGTDEHPLWFETMVFPAGKTDWAERYGDRYETWEQATEGHKSVVLQLAKGVDPADIERPE